jgi:KaiC/GvpD/RAD55 family RecA-like ATPase
MTWKERIMAWFHCGPASVARPPTAHHPATVDDAVLTEALRTADGLHRESSRRITSSSLESVLNAEASSHAIKSLVHDLESARDRLVLDVADDALDLLRESREPRKRA